MITVVGQLADELGAAFQTDVVASTDPGRSFDVRRRAWSFSSLEYRRAQPSVIPIDVEHQGPVIGELKYLELTPAGRLYACAEVDASDVGEGPWHLSSEIRHVEGRDIELVAVALTRSPASVGLQPVAAFPGSLDVAALRVVRQHGLEGEVVKRAREYDRRRRSGDPIVVVDRDRDVRLGRLVGRSASDPAVAVALMELADEEAAGRLPIRYGPAGRVLRVS